MKPAIFNIKQIPPGYFFIYADKYSNSDFKSFEKFYKESDTEIISNKDKRYKEEDFKDKELAIVTELYTPFFSIKETCYKGTRILLGDKKDDILSDMKLLLKSRGFNNIQIPIIHYSKYFENKVGEENNNLMFNFKDRGNRDLCLAPEYTAIIQELSKTVFKDYKDLKLFYVAECFRGEKPQKGRYRQFTQLGVEIVNPTKKYNLSDLAMELIGSYFEKDVLIVDKEIRRGLDYYKEGQGFEISLMDGERRAQLVGGGEYEGGVGFAIGIDRLLDYID